MTPKVAVLQQLRWILTKKPPVRLEPSYSDAGCATSLQLSFGGLQGGPQVSQCFALLSARSFDLLEFLLSSPQGLLDFFDCGFRFLPGLLCSLQLLPEPFFFFAETGPFRHQLFEAPLPG